MEKVNNFDREEGRNALLYTDFRFMLALSFMLQLKVKNYYKKNLVIAIRYHIILYLVVLSLVAKLLTRCIGPKPNANFRVTTVNCIVKTFVMNMINNQHF